MLSKNKINFIPFLADIILLFVIFFISVIILQQIKLQQSEDTFEIPANTFFQSMQYNLTDANKLGLINFLYENGFENLYEKFKNNTLKEIRITGFADQTQPSQNASRNKKWDTNRELSFLRANTVCNLLIEIAADSMNASYDDIEKFKGKLLPAGYGEYRPWNNYIYEIDRTWLRITGERRYNFKSISDSTWFKNKTYQELEDWKNEKNRRIEIKTIYNK